ncbi:hypothetical protein [Halorussus lipolyticus]|uniref:hypothetical protein n=1 Tax=Halorussus lipolyticus TaxID=3034024 RepID=UPI0023E8B8E1|nr:hypothetical protein [Halorussus sp. DT80]
MADDPRRIRSLAVTADDVVSAYEARQQSPRLLVLRATPPFSGRMRARLHDPGPAGTDSQSDLDPETGALLVPPARLLAEESVPSYPTPDETEDALRETPDEEVTVERHRERHVEAVEAWREAVADAIVETAALRVGEGETHQVEVKTLGKSSGE